MELSKRYANFVRVGSDGNVQAFDTNGLEFLKTIPSEQLLSKNNILDDGSGNMTIARSLYLPNNAGTNNYRLLFNNSFHSISSTGNGGNVMTFYEYQEFVFFNTNLDLNVFSINNKSVNSYNNTLDDGSGNVKFAGKFTGLNSNVGAMNGMPLLSASRGESIITTL